MTVDAHTDSGGPRYPVRTDTELARAFAAARRHSRMVRFLRKALPALAILVIAGYFVSSRLSVTVDGVTASVSGIEVSDGKLRMVNPKLKGADKKNGAYVITADYADQDIKNPKMIELHTIKAELNSTSGGWSRMKAVRGLFNSQTERLVLKDDIRVATSSGVTGVLTYATLDMSTQTLRSHVPVTFDLTNGTVHANALTMRSSEHIIVFRGKVRVHLDKTPEDAVAEKKPAPPQANAKPEAAASGSAAVAPTGNPR